MSALMGEKTILPYHILQCFMYDTLYAAVSAVFFAIKLVW